MSYLSVALWASSQSQSGVEIINSYTSVVHNYLIFFFFFPKASAKVIFLLIV